ncbi:MAG TPA: class I SAM-dependent methyltransferase [Candidatus Eisenbacteria bacterium]
MEVKNLEQYIAPERYDVAYSWHTANIPFWVERAKAAKGPVLEIGCGTGRVLIPTLAAGVDAEGLDLHPGMLEVLMKKAAAQGLTARVQRADMRDFTMPRRYALVTLPFRGFMHLLTTADQLQALRCIREHLEPGGALVLNLFYPTIALIAEPGDRERVEREFPHPETGLPVALVSVRRDHDRVHQLLSARAEMRESDARGYAGAVYGHAFTLRWTYRFEMELLLRTAGFSRYEVAGGFDGRPLLRDTDEMVWTAWRD